MISQRAYARAAYLTYFAAIGAMFPYLPLYFRSLGLQLDAVGLLGALSAAGAMLGAPVWGLVADRFHGSRLVLPAAATAAAVSAVVLALAHDTLVVVPVVAVMALAMAGVSPILDARALDAVAEDRHRYGRLRVWGSASFILSVLAVGWLVERNGIASLFIVLVGALLATAIVGLGLGSRSVVPPLPRLEGIRAVMRSPQLPAFLAAALVAWSSSSAINGFLSIYLLEIGAPEALVGVAWALGAVVELPLMVAFPWLAGRFGLERLLLLGAGLLGLRALALLVVQDPLLVTLTMLVHGAGFALLLVGGVTYVSRHAPQGAAATAQGLLSGVVFGMAMIVGPGVGGILARGLGLSGLFIVAAVGSVAALVALGWALGMPARFTVRRRTGADTSR